MKRSAPDKMNERNDSPTYVAVAVFMVVSVALYAILPPLFASRQRPQEKVPDVSNSIPGAGHVGTGAVASVSVDAGVSVEAGTDAEPSSGRGKGPGEVPVEDTSSFPRKDENESLMVETQYGPIKGTQRAGVRVFHGVRFAQPPLNELRWKEPRPVEPWGPSAFDASWIRPGCPQECAPSFCPANKIVMHTPTMKIGYFFKFRGHFDESERKGTSEDCLYVEIFAPFISGSRAEETGSEEGLPVMIYIHGGGFRDMAATTPLFDAAYLAGRGNMIIVLPEYRIGSLGFMVTGTSSDQAVGNYGFMDQKLAIEWVEDNIRAFGGDPKKITLAGHSAGALSVVQHLTTAETARRFRYVMLSSTPLTIPYRSVAMATARGHALAKQLGCFLDQQNKPDMACLRNKSVEDIRNAEDFMAANAPPAIGGLLDRMNPWAPVIDGGIVKYSPMDAMMQFANDIASDMSKMKPMLMGTTTEEAYLFVKDLAQFKSIGRLYLVFLSSATGTKLNDLSDLYPIKNASNILEDLSIVLTDFMFKCPLRAMQRHLVSSFAESLNSGDGGNSGTETKIWAYLWRPPMTGDIPEDMEFCRGKTCHGSELPFLFRNSDNSAPQPTGRQLKISDAVIDYVANFVATGDPNIPPGKGFENMKETHVRDSDSVKHNQKRDAKGYPHWEPVTGNAGFTEKPTWLCNALNFFKNSRLKMARQAVSKGKQCDMWDETDYKFPELFGTE